MRWQVINSGIFLNSLVFLIKGVNFFGFEDCGKILHGLQAHPLTWYLDFLQENQFNMIRLPFSEEWVLDDFETHMPDQNSVSADPALQGKTSFQIMDYLFDEAAKRGIFIVPDMHRLECASQDHELWYSLYNPKFTSDTFITAWQRIIDQFGSKQNFHGIDLLNEPRGLAQWSDNPVVSWNRFVDVAITSLNYSGIYYIEGTNWGRDFSDMKNHPLTADTDQIVYSSHVYGPSVTGGNQDLDVVQLHADWNTCFGYLIADNKPVVIGEFGGMYTGVDKEWQDIFVDYMHGLRIPGIYWSLNPDSRDTGGLLASDWTTPNTDKLDLLKRLQPYPTIVKNGTLGQRHLRGRG